MSLSWIGLAIVALIAAVAATQSVVVDVRGAVIVPGVYELPPGARIQDAVLAAGGLSPEADLSTINLAQLLRDGEVVAILELPEPGSSATPMDAMAPGSTEAPPQRGKINLNTATPAELELLPEIGEVTARRIVEYREENGPFRSVDDLIHVQGISDRTIDAFRDQVTVGP